jgi:hypothetical protein
MSLMPWNDLLVMRSYGNEQWREVGYSIMWDGIEVGISGVSFYQTGIYEKTKDGRKRRSADGRHASVKKGPRQK